MRVVKDMSMLALDPKRVVLIDDKPEFGINGYVIGVPEYRPNLDIDDLMQCMITNIPTHAAAIESIFAADARKHPPTAIDTASDSALYDAAQVLGSIFQTP